MASPVLVGRQRELERLATVLASRPTERAPLVLVSGEAGVGKTRLVSELTVRVRSAGLVVLTGGCVAVGEHGLPYAPFSEALRGLARSRSTNDLDDVLGQGRAALSTLLPDLSRGVVATPTSDPAGQARLCAAVLALLERLSQDTPVLLVVEDLHWADRSTLDLLTYLARNLVGANVLLVATQRSDEPGRGPELASFVAEQERAGRLERIDLAPLGHEDVRRLVEAILGVAPDTGLTAALSERSGGNPFYVEELLASRSQAGELPPDLRDVLLARLAALSGSTQQVLRFAAAIGVRFSGALLELGVGIDEGALLTAVREAVEHHVLVIREDGASEDVYGFRHALLREACYAELLPAERRNLHAAYARALTDANGDARDADLAAQLAYHWSAAGESRPALKASMLAGRAETSIFAFGDALLEWERVIDLWPVVDDAEALAGMDFGALLREAAEVAAAAGFPSRALAHIGRALELVESDVDPVRRGLLLEDLGRYSAANGDNEAAMDARDRAVELVPAEPPSRARAAVLAGLARSLTFAGHYSEARARARAALDIARATAARAIEANALMTLGVDEGYLGELDGAVAHLGVARDTAFSVGDTDTGLRAWCNLVNLLEVSGRADEAAEAGAAAAAAIERHGMGRALLAGALCPGGGALYELGRWDEAGAACERIRRSDPEGDAWFGYQITAAWLEVGRGEWEAVERRLEVVRGLYRPDTREQWKVFAANAEAQLDLARGDLGAAQTAIASALLLMDRFGAGDLVPTLWLFPTGIQVEAAIAGAAGRRSRSRGQAAVGRARHLLRRARTAMEDIERELPALARRPRAALALAEAEASRVDGDGEPDAWSRAVAALTAAPHAGLAAYAQYRLTEALLDAGRRAEAKQALDACLSLSRDLGAAPVIAAAEEIARHARLNIAAEPPPATALRSGTAGLTRREVEVLELLAQGRTNRQIGEALFITERTAGVHVSHILGKLGVSNRSEAAAVMHRLARSRGTPDGSRTNDCRHDDGR